MERTKILIFIVVSYISANPLLTDVINEFQTDTILGQKFEFHPIQYGFEIPLLNTRVTTPAGTAYVDTSITNSPYGYTAIDNSMLNGSFYLPLTAGYIYVYLYDYFTDFISYADTNNSPILSPPMGASASRFIFILFNNPNFFLDWYIDHTPTLGSENDDYPGCVIQGYVYLNGVPVESAEVTATVIDSIVTQGPFYKTCTTYTNNNGFYTIDSLWPLRYWMTASFGGYQPSGELSPRLCALWPKNLNFNFVGVDNNLSFESVSGPGLYVYPNPFQNYLVIKYEVRNPKFEINPNSQIPNTILKIYDAGGRLVKQFNHLTNHQFNYVLWYGDDNSGCRLPTGVYFVRLESEWCKQVEKVILLR